LPVRTKHSSGISCRERLFWIVGQWNTPPLNSPERGPAQIGGNAAFNSSMISLNRSSMTDDDD
jgi:hypothetical protein